jgi:RHS repeat-associated protein
MAIGNNPSGQPSSINGQNRTQSFSYDDLGRLVSAASWGISQRNYVYDRWGNRTAMSDSIMGVSQSISLQQQPGAPAGVPSNRITSLTNNGVTSNYVYDASGNLTNDGGHSYQYDGENRIATLDGGVVTSSYDSVNRRVKKVTAAGTTYYLWEGDKVIAEYSTVAGPTAGGLKYYLNDKLSARLTTDSVGGVLGGQDHLPFGEEGGVFGEVEKHRFTTYERDAESGSDYAINRQYSPSSGRFNRADPFNGSSNLHNPQLFNRYSADGNDPINFVDPLGLVRSLCFGYHVYILSVNRATGNVLSSRYAGFLATFCVSLDFDKEVREALKELLRLIQKKKCRDFLERIAFEAFLKSTGVKPTEEEAQFIRSNVTSADALTNALDTATKINKGDEVSARGSRAEANFKDQSITFYKEFFSQAQTTDIRINDEPRVRYRARTPVEKAQSLLHEGLHLLFRAASDALLGEVISKKPVTGSENERTKKGSEIIQKAIDDHCKE